MALKTETMEALTHELAASAMSRDRVLLVALIRENPELGICERDAVMEQARRWYAS